MKKLLTRNNGLLILIAALYIATGFFREFLFLNINEQYRVSFYHDTDSQVAPSMQWLSKLSLGTLYYGKFPLTFLFAAWFATLSAWFVKIAFNNRAFVRITWISFGAVFLAGALFYALGEITGNKDATYAIARFLAGLTETPALLFILIATFIALPRIKNS